MDPTAAFREAVERPDHEVPLDRAALLLAAHDHPVDVTRELRSLDDLAAAAPRTAAALATHLFDELGFAGNAADYGDPGNSYLDEVIRRRLGLPITLSVLMIEVGRRADLDLVGVGMPAHFLVRDASASDDYFDPFHAGRPLDAAGCRSLFESLAPGAPFTDRYLAPVGAHAILARMLANLVQTFVRRDPPGAVWALRLRLVVPGVAPDERRQAARLLGTLGRFEEAAIALESLADHDPTGDAARDEREAAALRARAN